MYFSKILICLAVAVAATAAETIQLEPTQGILIPAPIAQSLRFARASYGGGPSYGGAAPAPAAAPSYAAPSAPPAYKPASIPSPPCPKNYLFSCQPSLSPVPCAAPAPSYSSPQGAYSQYEPQYAYPVVRELY